jgi:hypothetical protein
MLDEGLTLSLIGILVTFSALGILILLIILLKVFFPTKEIDATGKIRGFEVDERELLKEQAAAVAVSVLLDQLSGRRRSSLGSTLEEPVGNWWRKGIDRIHGKE